MASAPAANRSSAVRGVMPTPPAAFSPLTTTKVGTYSSSSAGSRARSVRRPRPPTTSPMKRIVVSGTRGGYLQRDPSPAFPRASRGPPVDPAGRRAADRPGGLVAGPGGGDRRADLRRGGGDRPDPQPADQARRAPRPPDDRRLSRLRLAGRRRPRRGLLDRQSDRRPGGRAAARPAGPRRGGRPRARRRPALLRRAGHRGRGRAPGPARTEDPAGP